MSLKEALKLIEVTEKNIANIVDVTSWMKNQMTFKNCIVEENTQFSVHMNDINFLSSLTKSSQVLSRGSISQLF